MAYHSNQCFPCGDCPWCRYGKRCRREAPALRRALRQALAALEAARDQLWREYFAAGGDPEAKTNPALRANGRLLTRTTRTIERLTPLTRARH